MNESFKNGFEKRASIIGSLLGIGGALAAPSINKRIVSNTIDRSKLLRMGLPHTGDSKTLNRLSDRLNKDLDWLETLPDNSIRKKVNKFLFTEGPGTVLYTPAIKGRELGTGLNNLSAQLPEIDKTLLANMTSSDSDSAVKALQELSSQAKGIRSKLHNSLIAGLVLLGAGTGGYIAGGKYRAKKEERKAMPSSRISSY